MSYLVLARKWRPKRFAELVGQEHVVRALTNALDSGRVHHAFLFTGTRGVGKTTIARIFAKSLNCERGTSADPCGECNSCRDIDAGRFIDLLEIDAASNTGVDDVREVIDNAQYMPSRGRVKVYLIDEVHMLSKSAFNALLKTLEEPPGHVKFLLATTDPQKLPVTVLSRCLQFNLKRLDEEQIRGQMRKILEAEQIPVEDGAIRQLARAADGSLRDGLSLLDQAIAYTASQLTDAAVATMLGTVDRGHVGALLDTLAAGDGAALMAEVERLGEFSPDWDDVLEAIAEALHHVQVRQLVPGAVLEVEGLAVDALAEALAPELVQLWYQMALNGRRDLPLAPGPRAGFEMVMLRMLAFRPDAGSDGTSVRSERPVASAPQRQRGDAAAAARAELSRAKVEVASADPQARATPSLTSSTPAATSEPAAMPVASNVHTGKPGATGVALEEVARSHGAETLAAPRLDAPTSPEVASTFVTTGGNVRPHEMPTETVAADSGIADADAWRDWVAACDLRGPARILAENVGFVGCSAGVLSLSIEPSDEHLKGPAMVKMLTDALVPRFGRAPQIRFEAPARPVDSVRVHLERARDAKQTTAERDFEQHPDVRKLVAQGARIVPESVRPLEG
ncbi:DNA polymerase III subunit gamma/tau [Cognatilysobacter lacus]|uniref:DNA polymerase III subunit gamma/tau n=1 Tax=Cognatilysobacter lacus TaxID=1643323 RepID=A0A5D8ZAP1_9GAMM|nr:DNA polymerase III subunit gamma/tau [Lysobacter lacus]TZF91700.1 DNA polymerase III subunit gamma/tau [Lysobacter lacus]